jgi:hypothetical protein
MTKNRSLSDSASRVDLLENHRLRGTITPADNQSTQPSIFSFLSFVDPPIGVNMAGIDTQNPNYKVSVMTAISRTGQVLIIPFAEPVAWNPASAPVVRVQYFLNSTLGSDPGPDFYETMILSQPLPGGQTIRSRIFVPPSSQQFGNPVLLSTATAANPSLIQVNGVVDSSNLTRSVQYLHFTVADGAPDLFLQQPWTS